MTKLDLNITYNARLTVHDHAEISARWDKAAEQYRQEAEAELDIPYGPGEREKYDFFPAESPDAPICCYIHGGYWRSRNRKTFSHIARGLNGCGISVAIPSYDLVPNVSLMTIIWQMRAFLTQLWSNTEKRPVVAGNSAGGHLTATMLATDWGSSDGVPDDLVTRAFALSGLYDLNPLLQTNINDDIKLDENSARDASPVFWPAPREGLKFMASVGALESNVFKEQSRRLAEVWNEAGIETEYFEVPDCNHFTIVDAVSTPGEVLFEKLVSTIESHSTESHSTS
jgi:arylformamidase